MFFAADAAQAREYILEVAKKNNVKRVVKGKSMTTEEIGLNNSLMRTGIEVTETDLGEYIVQLRHEPPSHIITPAIHLSKEDIGQLFADKLHTPYTAEPEELTAQAREQAARDFPRGRDGYHRRQLRDRGNRHAGGDRERRQRTPVQHAAGNFRGVMGIEKVIPKLEDDRATSWRCSRAPRPGRS